jgi:phosphate transport system permease protein
VSRALGETAPLITIGALTFIAFLPTPPIQSTPPYVNMQWLWDGFTVLPIQAFNWISRPGDDFVSNAAAASIVLLVITLGLNGFAIWLRARLRRRLKW